MNNSKKPIIIIAGIIAFIVLIIVIIKLMPTQKQADITVTPTPEEVLPTISGNVTVDLTAQNKQTVKLAISGYPSDIESIEYELTYQTGAGLPRGVLGKITLHGEKEITRDDIVLGTCSSGKCVYDAGVTTVDLSLKFNSSSGQSYIYKKSYSI